MKKIIEQFLKIFRNGNIIRNYGKGNNLSIQGLKNSTITIYGNNNTIRIEKGATVSMVNITIYGHNHQLILGKCHIKKGSFWFEDNDCLIKISDGVSIEEAAFSAAEPNSKIIIGENCLFSYGIDLRTTDSHSIIDLTSNRRFNPAGDIIIEDHVWIGAYVQILKNVTVKKDSVIGIRSVVTKDISSNSIAVGSPAKIVQGNVTWDHKRF